MILISITFQVSCGPWEAHKWWRKVEEGCRSFLRNNGAEQCTVSHDYLRAVAHDRNEPRSKVLDPRWVEERYNDLDGAEGSALANAGARLVWSRFGSWLDCFVYWDGLWHLRVIAWIVCGILLGFVDHTTAKKPVSLSLESASAHAAASGDANTSTKEAKKKGTIQALRKHGKNMLHSSLLTMLVPNLQRWCRIVYAGASPYRSRHGEQARDNKSPESNIEYYCNEASGACLEPIMESLRKPFTMTEQRKVGLKTCEAEMPTGVKDEDHVCILEEAHCFAKWIFLTMSLAGTRPPHRPAAPRGLPRVLLGAAKPRPRQAGGLPEKDARTGKSGWRRKGTRSRTGPSTRRSRFTRRST